MKINWESGGIAGVWMVVIISYICIVLTYAIFSGLVNATLYNLVVDSCSGISSLSWCSPVALHIKNFWAIFAVVYLAAITLWAVMSSLRREKESIRYV